MSVEEMAQAHLTTIQKAIDELNNQKQTIENRFISFVLHTETSIK